MKKLTKFTILCLVGIIAFGLFNAAVSGKSLREKDQDAKAKYQTARQQYLKEVNAYKTFRQQLLNARQKYRKFKNVENKAEYETNARIFLERTVDVLIKKLEALKNWVSNRRGISETERQTIIAEIDEDINWLKDKKPGIATATPLQIKEKAKEIREYWKNHRVHVKRIIAQVWGARLSWSIERFENVSAKIAVKIDELKTTGRDTAQLETWLDDFNQKISTAKEKKEMAKEKYQAISSLADADKLFRQAHQFIKEANNYLRQAHQDLVKIVKEMKKLSASNIPAESSPSESTSTE